jgi:Rad52/22 family double-strand break repair protein
MSFSAKQVRSLRRQPDHRFIRTREANGRELTYLEGWYAISEANRIFGFDGWNRETVESKCVLRSAMRLPSLAGGFFSNRIRIRLTPYRCLERGFWVRSAKMKEPMSAIMGFPCRTCVVSYGQC